MRLSLVPLLILPVLLLGEEQAVAVNDHFALGYEREPVSFDFAPSTPTPLAAIGLKEAPSQVELVAGTREAATGVRVWTEVSFPLIRQKKEGKDGETVIEWGVPKGAERKQTFTITTEATAIEGDSLVTAEEGEPFSGVPTAIVDNGLLKARVVVGEARFDPPAAAYDLPGPVVALGHDGGPLLGEGTLSTMRRVTAITATVTHGPVFWESDIVYAFEGGKHYRARVRLPNAKRYVMLSEDFDLGGQARYLWSSGASATHGFLRTHGQGGPAWSWEPMDTPNPCYDYTRLPGQTALARLVIWSQYGYFGGKQEIVGLKLGDSAIGGFLARVDRWTRPKVNHVDLYLRPQVPGERSTRGTVGLEGSVEQAAFEAWLIEGHREWCLFAVPADHAPILANGPMREGQWPLDRLNRIPVAWNEAGELLTAVDTTPGDKPQRGLPASVFNKTGGFTGLNTFNHTGHVVRTLYKSKYPVTKPLADYEQKAGMSVHDAVTIEIMLDDVTYPGKRTMLPWSDPEAVNPFYQGMQNMGFHHGLLKMTMNLCDKLLNHGHPAVKPILDLVVEGVDMSFDTYVSPQSGCWWTGHSYATGQMKRLVEFGQTLDGWGLTAFRDDLRMARLGHFFSRVLSPIDAEFGQRIMAPIGDHGLSLETPTSRLTPVAQFCRESTNEAVQRLVSEMAWFIREDSGPVPEGVTPIEPERRGGWLQGYGSTMRAVDANVRRLQLNLPDALLRVEGKGKKQSISAHAIQLRIGLDAKGQANKVRAARVAGGFEGAEVTFERFTFDGTTVSAAIAVKVPHPDDWRNHQRGRLKGEMRWFTGTYELNATVSGDQVSGRFSGTSSEQEVGGELDGRIDAAESFVIVRAGQTWGHHHADKASLWFWARDVHFLGECAWGGPPGGAYGNPYKQGPAQGTQLEFVGINNWTLPCMFPAPWIADSQYAEGVDYALARSLYPYNPKTDLSRSSPVALTNGCDRQVLLVHPETLIVRDNIEANVPVIWRAHGLQKKGTTVSGNRATMRSPQGPVAELAVVHPAATELTVVDTVPAGTGGSAEEGKPFSTSLLRFDVPPAADVTWVVDVRGEADQSGTVEPLDQAGRVTRIRRSDGSQVIAFLNSSEFTATVAGRTFTGTVGVLLVGPDGSLSERAIRGSFKAAE